MPGTNDGAPSRQEAVERFDLLVADVREYAVFVTAPDGTIMCWNPGAERLLGYQANEAVGQHFSRFFVPEDVRSGQPEHELKRSLADGRADAVCWHVRKDETRFWCKSTITPLFGENKQVRCFARVMHDLTDTEARPPKPNVRTTWPMPIAAGRLSWRCCRMSFATLFRPSSTPSRSYTT